MVVDNITTMCSVMGLKNNIYIYINKVHNVTERGLRGKYEVATGEHPFALWDESAGSV